MAHPVIKFGTDGWRGVIANDFTFENVRVAATAIAAYLLAQSDEKQKASRGVCIGYDSRFLSKEFARAVAEVIAGTGIAVEIADTITPTPALSYGVRERGAAGGVMITSSHNPAQWNGVKYKGYFGGSGTPAMIKEIESYLGQPVPKAATPAAIKEVDFITPYMTAVESFVDLDLIAKSGLKFGIDSMYGAGQHLIGGVFDRLGVDYVQIRGEANPLFPGINPE
ncbi:MAG TPA: phosphoglucomutase/phosphomannomutase family protein, partial [Acidobacteriaceae bacterium]